MSADIESLQRAYDELPYTSLPFPQCAPERLAAIAHLFGVSAPDPGSARVLELGCAAGGNLVPYAARNPGASALGIDLSGRQIDDGQKVIAGLGLGNIRLQQGDLSTLAADLGSFDYILCHGVFSWVPAPVQDAILRICRQHLGAGGVAFVSYNIYPGWKAKEIVRDAMLFGSVGRGSARQRLQSGRAMIDLLEKGARPDSLLSKVMAENAALVRDGKDDYVVHEFLEPNNQPCYFHDFLTHAASHQLAYLADAEPITMFATNLPREISEALLRDHGGDQRQLEQCMDFVNNRAFRQTLLLHEARAAQTRYRLADERLRTLHYAADLPCHDDAIRFDGSAQRFGSGSGNGREHNVSLTHPAIKSVAALLTAAWPATLGFDALLIAARARGGDDSAQAERQLLDFLGFLVRRGMARYRLQPVVAGRVPGAMPRILDIARHHAALIAESSGNGHVFNVWHEPVAVNAADAEVFALLDGQHDADAIGAHLHDAVARGRLRFHRDGSTLAGGALAAAIRERVEHLFAQLKDMKLLQ